MNEAAQLIVAEGVYFLCLSGGVGLFFYLATRD